MGYRAIFVLSSFSFLLSWLFGWEAVWIGPGVSAIVPAALAFTIIGGLGGIVGVALRNNETRLRALEQLATKGERT